MKKTSKKPIGIELLIKKYKEIYRIPENLGHYSEEDFRTAERKFLKWAVGGGESNREQLFKLLAH
jgi:hypothetical protein